MRTGIVLNAVDTLFVCFVVDCKTPNESRLSYQEEVHAAFDGLSSALRTQQPTLTTTRRGLRWEDALVELRVPLRALYAFYGERGLRARGFPLWAVEGIRTMTLPEDVA